MTVIISTQFATNPAKGSITTDGTEQSIVAASVSGIYTLQIQLTNMVDGDEAELRHYIKVNGGSKVELGFMTIGNNVPAVLFGPFEDAGYVEFTIKRTAGTDRAYPWQVLNAEGV